MKVLPSPRRGFTAKYLERKVAEAYEKAAQIATDMDSCSPSQGNRYCGKDIADAIRALKGPQ